MFAVAGVANTVYHPADYAMLSDQVSPQRMAQAYSMHTFAGLLGSAVTPGTVLFLERLVGWRGAFYGAAIFGVLVALVLLFHTDDEPMRPPAKPLCEGEPHDTGWRLLLSPPMLVNFLFFTLLAFAGFGLQNFSVVALGALHGTSPVTANAALTGYLALSALGVLIGGWLAGRITNFRLAASLGLFATVVASVLIASIDLGVVLLVVAMSVAGLCGGLVMPSRDMIVRESTPPGEFGKVFGFVTNGFNIGGIAAPLLFGALLDHGEPRLVLLSIAVFTLLSIGAVVCVPRRRGF